MLSRTRKMSSASARLARVGRLARIDRRVDDLDPVRVEHAGDLGEQAGRVRRRQHHLGQAEARVVRHVDDRALALLAPRAHQAHVRGDARLDVLGEVAAREPGEQTRPSAVAVAALRRASRRAGAPPPFCRSATISARSACKRSGPAAQERQRARVQLARAASPSSSTSRRARPTRDRRTSAGTARAASPRRRTTRGEVGDHPEVLEIAPLRHLAHHQVLPHQEVDPLDVRRSSMPRRLQIVTASPAPISLCGLPYGLPTSCSSVPTASATGRVTSRTVSLGIGNAAA